MIWEDQLGRAPSYSRPILWEQGMPHHLKTGAIRSLQLLLEEPETHFSMLEYETAFYAHQCDA